jgi:hypothetical protein
MCCVGNVGSRRFLQKVEFADDAPIVEMVVERWRLFIALENFSGGGWRLFACYSPGKLNLVNDLFN